MTYPRTRRAFALAMVLLIGSVVVVMSGVMIQRHAAGRLGVQRELDGYRSHHAGRGLTEVTNAWLQSLRNDEILDMIGEDGHVFDLLVDDGTTVTVSLQDAQGTVLSDPSLVAKSEQEDVEGILQHLRELLGGQEIAPFLRNAGPLKVSARTASEEVLDAVVLQATKGEGAPGLVSDILSERHKDDFADLAISQAISRAGVSVEARTTLRRMLTAEPELWFVRAELRPRGARTPSDAYEGLARLNARSGTRGSASGFSPWGPFLSWERVDVEPIP